jgi:hypothetical protein
MRHTPRETSKDVGKRHVHVVNVQVNEIDAPVVGARHLVLRNDRQELVFRGNRLNVVERRAKRL